MNVTRVKLWMFRIELDDGWVFTVNRRGDQWCFGPEGKATTCREKTLWDSMRRDVLSPHKAQAIDMIVELLVREGIDAKAKVGKERHDSSV